MLERALRAVRPAYDTQDLALRSGIYAGVEAPREASVPGVAAATPPPPAPRDAAPAGRSPMAAAADAAAAARAAGSPGAAREPEPAATVPARPPGHEPMRLPTPAPVSVDYVVQIAAFRDGASAHAALQLARREHPELAVSLESHDGVHRVVLGGWSDMAAAEARLPELRRLYPAAWARRRAVP
jgi:cell division septation protein DedD